MSVHDLPWSAVDPATHPFDPGPARAIATEILLDPACRKTRRSEDLDVLELSLDRALLSAYGAWATGWRWAASEPGGGGPVRAWCCGPHSLKLADTPHVMETIDRVVAALAEFRSFLEGLSGVFAELRERTAHLSLDEGIERATARLLPLVLERTSAEDAWYATFTRVLGWYLESAGHEPHAFRAAVSTVVSGRFSSWATPDDAVAASACVELGSAVAKAVSAHDAPADALAAWCSIRGSAFRLAPDSGRRDPAREDGHQRYIEGPERARDAERAARMLAALDACRTSARRGETLTFERLAAWQRIVLGKEVAFRTTDAYAKGGRERYGLDADTERRLIAALVEANHTDTPAPVRAARVYLDVCFFHPFEDGNGRAARLSLDHVLTRAGLALHAAEPLFLLSRAAGDPDGAWHLAWLIDHLAGEACP